MKGSSSKLWLSSRYWWPLMLLISSNSVTSVSYRNWTVCDSSNACNCTSGDGSDEDVPRCQRHGTQMCRGYFNWYSSAAAASSVHRPICRLTHIVIWRQRPFTANIVPKSFSMETSLRPSTSDMYSSDRLTPQNHLWNQTPSC